MSLLPGEDLNELFVSFERTADRLEVRDRYSDPVEDEVVRRYVAGEPDDMAWAKPWLDQVRKLASEGKRFRRVRVVSLPLSDYQRCGVLAVVAHNIEAGEDIRYLAREQADDLPQFDYWVFDAGTAAARVAKLHFDDADRLLGAEIISESSLIDPLDRALKSAYERALSPEGFAVERGLR